MGDSENRTLIKRSSEDRRKVKDRRESEHLTTKKMFHDYGVVEERSGKPRRILPDRRKS